MGGIGKGAWTEAEDKLLIESVTKHGARRWPKVAKEAGLNRCGKSCRLRWLNYLRPDIKRGNFSSDEEDLIIKLHKLLGNRWSLIAGRLPGRTDNEVKNYWNSTLAKRGNNKTQANPSTANHTNDVSRPPPSPEPEYFRNEADNALEYTVPSAIRTHAARCTKYFIDSHSDKIDERASKMDAPPTTDDHVSPNDSSDGGASSNSTAFYGHVENFLMEIDTDGDQLDLGPNFWSAMLDDWGGGDDELSLLGPMSPGINH